MNRTGIENGRAAFAFVEVQNYINTRSENKKDFRAQVKKMPSMIQVNGLGETLAFYFSKSIVHKDIYEMINKWVRRSMSTTIASYDPDNEEELVKVVINMPSRDYRLVTRETLALLNWMRRFADGLITEDSQPSGEGSA